LVHWEKVERKEGRGVLGNHLTPLVRNSSEKPPEEEALVRKIDQAIKEREVHSFRLARLIFRGCGDQLVLGVVVKPRGGGRCVSVPLIRGGKIPYLAPEKRKRGDNEQLLLASSFLWLNCESEIRAFLPGPTGQIDSH
jgi:hypothetical protein